jgi:RNA polymerase sigma-B factor
MATTEALAGSASSGDPAAREELVLRMLPFVRSLALRYRHGNEPVEDLIQVASLGLLKAVDRFDPERGTRFQAFALPTILGELKRHFRDRAMPIHLPRGLKENLLEVNEATDELTVELDHAPTVSELADRAELSREQVEEAVRAARAIRIVSLDAPPRDVETDPGSVLETLGEVDRRLELAEARMALWRASRALDRRERAVVNLRFAGDLTQQEIADRIGVSQVHVSRILQAALGKLRTAVGEERMTEAA